MAQFVQRPAPGRPVLHRSGGTRSGPITRLMNPGDFGELVKPFVFLDLFEMDSSVRRGFVPHPHSGIATLTVFLEGRMTYGDTTGKKGSMSDRSVEWMLAGGGVWHAGQPDPGHSMRGYQLWLALPPGWELAPAHSLYLDADHVGSVGPARVLLGSYGDRRSPIPWSLPITYLHVRLAHGERWTYRPADGQDVAWLATNVGRVHTGGSVLEREMAVFAEGGEAIDIVAEGEVELVIGSAEKHPFPLVTGASSVHTSATALAEGERSIRELRVGPAFAELVRR